jgi:sugar phosphate isomerase/epimerase
MINCINEAVLYAKKTDIQLAIETHGGAKEVSRGIMMHFHSTTTKQELLLKILEQTDASVGFVLDPANLGAVGYNKDEIIRLFYKKNRISYMHLKDFKSVAAGVLNLSACGDGKLEEINLQAINKNVIMAQYAIRWILQQTGIVCAIVGVKNRKISTGDNNSKKSGGS